MIITVTLVVQQHDEQGLALGQPLPPVTFKEREERAMLWQRETEIERDGRVFTVSRVRWMQDGGLAIRVRETVRAGEP